MTDPERINDAHTHFHSVLDIPIEGILTTHMAFSESAAFELGDILKRAAQVGTAGGGVVTHPPTAVRTTNAHDSPASLTATKPPALQWGSVQGYGLDPGSSGLSAVLELQSVAPSPRAFLRWVRQLTLSPQALLEYYLGNVVKADRVMCHLIDLDGFYPGEPARDVDQRHQVFEDFLNSNLKVHGFVGFNPLRGDSLDRLIHLRSRLGDRLGVKFYPPAGYRPIGNDAESVPEGRDPAVIDKRNLALFEWCSNQDVPIFAHCSRVGFTSDSRFRQNSDPVHWRNLFDGRPDLSFRLCLGHAGGADDWVNWHRPTDLAREAATLAQDFPRVFLDFGHFEEILNGGFQHDMFSRSFGWACQEFPEAMERAMFGTDWHVANALVREQNYVRAFSSAIERTGRLAIDGFFWEASNQFLAG